MARARELRPDLLLLDIVMPKLDGIEVTRRLKSDASLPFVPIILLTARADTKDVVAGLDAGADDYLAKSADHAALDARVRSMLRIKGLHDTVEAQHEDLKALNATLERRVTAQVAEIERIGRLRRFLAPQLAEMIMGYATLGRVGFKDQIDYTAMGTVTNLASRLCAVAENGQILVSQRVAAAVDHATRLEGVGDVPLKGLTRPGTVHQVIGLGQSAEGTNM